MVPEYLRCPPAWFYSRILVGAGQSLTRTLVANAKIGYVINCASDDMCPDWWKTNFPSRYVCLNAIDSPHVSILDWYPAFEAALQRFLRMGSETVYIHCQAGMNRSGFLALAYVCKHYHLPMEDVIVATRRQRYVLFRNPVFMNQVKHFIENGRVSCEKNT